MTEKIIMSAVLLIVPLTMITMGKLLKRFPPPMNSMIGYRTKRSGRDEESWMLAQELIADIWMRWGLITLLFTLAAVSYILMTDAESAGKLTVFLIYAQMGPLIGAIIPVERALKEHQEGT